MKRWIIAKLAALIGSFVLCLANVTGRACQHEPHSTTTHTHSPCNLPLLQCNADFHNHVDDHNALCGVLSASSAWCTRVPAASCLLPGALCRLNGDCCSVALAVALCLKAVHILHNLLDPPLGITFHYSPSLPWRSTTFGRDLSCNLARKGEILVPHKLIPAMPFSRITNRRLAKHTNTHKCVCVCWHPLWRATAMSHDRQLGNWPRFRST